MVLRFLQRDISFSLQEEVAVAEVGPAHRARIMLELVPVPLYLRQMVQCANMYLLEPQFSPFKRGRVNMEPFDSNQPHNGDDEEEEEEEYEEEDEEDEEDEEEEEEEDF